MKKIIVFLLFTQFTFSQQPYYNNVDLTLTGQAMYDELQQKISTHNTSFTYGDARDVLIFTDENPSNTNDVLLTYGYNDNDGNCTTDRSRDKNDFGGMSCEYNREHVFARSQPVPDMGDANNGSTGIVADPHNIRATDQQMNNTRGSKLFQDGSGNAGDVGSGNWYPGDEWKGDVARMIMYMYTRYGNQCLPSYAGVGSFQGSTQMLQTFLDWNAEDPVSAYEDQRNDYLQTTYSNRNPFIDNPYLATVIWGGVPAEDRWGTLATQDISEFDFVMYPNPTVNNTVSISTTTTVDSLVFYDINGRVILNIKNPVTVSNIIEINDIPEGFYLVKISSDSNSSTKKLIVN
ncbi:MAG: endonuclease [Flavobacteriaceae bacterium]